MRLLFLLAAVASAEAYKSYLPWNPNALSIPWTIAIGHKDAWGQAGPNIYGIDFSNNGHVWNKPLACLDSDGDKVPNGFELGDPCGDWKWNRHAHPLWCNDISAPGNATSVPLTRTVNYTEYCEDRCVCRDPIVQRQMRRIIAARHDFVASLAEPLRAAWGPAIEAAIAESEARLAADAAAWRDDPDDPCKQPGPPGPSGGSGGGGGDADDGEEAVAEGLKVQRNPQQLPPAPPVHQHQPHHLPARLGGGLRLGKHRPAAPVALPAAVAAGAEAAAERQLQAAEERP